jgi:hypothetical protein
MLEKANLVSYLTDIVTWQNGFFLPLEGVGSGRGWQIIFITASYHHPPNPLPSRRGNFAGQEIIKIFPKCDLRRTL